MDSLTLLLWVFGILFGLIFFLVFIFGVGWLIYWISKRRLERRYKKENDRGRKCPGKVIAKPSRKSPELIQLIESRDSNEPNDSPVIPDEREPEINSNLLSRLKKAIRKG